MHCCICGRDLTGLPAMVDNATGEAFCEQDSHYFGLDPSQRPGFAAAPSPAVSSQHRGGRVASTTALPEWALTLLGGGTLIVALVDGFAGLIALLSRNVLPGIACAAVAVAYMLTYLSWRNGEITARWAPYAVLVSGLAAWVALLVIWASGLNVQYYP